MTFDEWYNYGIEQKWVMPATCYTHDGIATSEQEDKLFEDGLDPCIHVARLCDTTEWLEIHDNTPSMAWRHNK